MATHDQSSGMLRLDVNDPADVQMLVDRGYAWVSGPKTLQKIFDHIVSGRVARAPEKETPQVCAYLDRLMARHPSEATDTAD